VGCDSVLAIMRVHQLSSQSGEHAIAINFDHFGALYAVNVQMAPISYRSSFFL